MSHHWIVFVLDERLNILLLCRISRLKSEVWFVDQESLFITYSQGQDLEIDKAATRKALLIRIIFQALGTGSFGAAKPAQIYVCSP